MEAKQAIILQLLSMIQIYNTQIQSYFDNDITFLFFLKI